MNQPFRLRVSTSRHPYDIVVGDGVIDDRHAWEGIDFAPGALVVTDRTVGPLYAERVASLLGAQTDMVRVLELDDGEANKTWSGVERIADALLDMRAGRSSRIVAVGGGVVGDVAGFAAGCYMRGIEFVQVPTTLLAQVDSSVGGKTAVNHPRSKNLLGLFHPPIRVIADTATLRTLPQREFVAGLAEVIKYGAMADLELLAWLEQHLDRLLAHEETAIAHAVRRSCEIKARIVAADEKETGLRVTLNFGHTFAHAIEAGAGYGIWLHGEAVGCGMAMAADASRRLGLLSKQDCDRLIRLIARAGLPVRPPGLEADRWLDLMRSDKKAEGGDIRLVLLSGLGQAVLMGVDEPVVRAAVSHATTPESP